MVLRKVISGRRAFLAGAAAVALPFASWTQNEPAETAAARVERLRKLYGSLKSYSDVTRTTTVALGMNTAGEIRTAFVAPGRLCLQTAFGATRMCHIVEDDTLEHWSPAKGWRKKQKFALGLMGLGPWGTASALGLSPFCVVALLFDKRFEDPDGLRVLEDASCALSAGRCTGLQGKIEDYRVFVDLDAETGAMRKMRTEAKLNGVAPVIDATIDAKFNSAVDIEALIAGARRDPGKPIKI